MAILVMPSVAYAVLVSMWGDQGVSHWLQFALMWFASCDSVSHSLLFLFFTPSFRSVGRAFGDVAPTITHAKRK